MKIGIVCGTAGNTPQVRAVADALQAECYAWTALVAKPDGTTAPHNPSDARGIDAPHVLRIPTPAPNETPVDWMARIVPVVDRWAAAGFAPGQLLVQHANEPDVPGADVPVPWDIDAWLSAAHGYRDALTARYPNLPVLAPPFTCANTKRITAAYVDGYPGIAVHCYFDKDNPGWRQGIDGGVAWVMATPYERAVWITEVNSNPSDAGELLAWIGEAHDQPLLMGAMIFIADGGASGFPQYDLTIEQAAAIRAGLITPPEQPAVYTRSYDPRGFHPLDARWQPFIAAHNPDEAAAICAAYDGSCAAVGYDANAAIAQGAVETAIFTSSRWRTAHNAAGIGIYSDGTPDVQFGDVQTGIRAQAELLSDYFCGGNEPWGVLRRYGFGGMNLGKTKLSDMDGVWAADTSYSVAIVGYLNQVLTGGAVDPVTPATGPTLGDIFRVAAAHLGNDRTDEGNPEFGMCEQFVEEVVEEVTGRRVRYPSAAAHGADIAAQGRFLAGAWKRGMVLAWDGRFDVNGHTCFGDDFPFVITTYRDSDPATIDVISRIDAVANGWYGANGYLGAYIPDGVTDGDAPTQEVDVLVEGHLDDAMIERLWYGAATKTAMKKMAYNPTSGIGQRWKKELLAGHPLGAVESGEEKDAASGRIVQFFSNGAITYVVATGETFVN